ncbi:DUF2971 domain-containing protein [Burkholderia cepacia]|uniref:DUF2971 domain-containing protein n=1 Tax=Burkholderia cepacia TaxID=292 RepID=A0AA88YZQ1_BURCE|nr:DUF2971 domain-containing protein [Burkholderia cepacia]KGB92022.1 hypothetical protein DM43_2341 [Burkholderia cepacia]
MSWIDEFVEMLFPLDASSLRIEQAFTLKHQNLPKTVFKYRGVNKHSLKNLRDNTIWLADPRSFNDPYDCSVFVDFDRMAKDLYKNPPRELIERLTKHLPAQRVIDIQAAMRNADNTQDALLDEVLRDMPAEKIEVAKAALKAINTMTYHDMASKSSEAFKNGFKVCSFSARKDSTLMWSHYADYHKGFCIEYSLENTTPKDFLSRFMYPVIYSERPFDATDNISNFAEKSPNSLYLNKAGLIKSTDWEYEREWRLIFSNGVMKSEQAYDMPTPTAVYLGSHISQKDQDDILNICKEKGIPVKKMKHSPSVFRMEALDINKASTG